MTTIDLILVGGFLGAGKTSLLHAAAKQLAADGRRVGLITNDQASQLVDSTVLGADAPVAEVAGSCFCCNFDGLMLACDELILQQVDTIIAEPVGSCTDLSATILQPLKDRHGDRFRIAPLSVLADPQRLLEAYADQPGALHQATTYIYKLQLEEADRLLIGKADTLSDDAADALMAQCRKRFPDLPIHLLSAHSGLGLETWLADVLAGGPAGQRILTVDYDRYAEGEAVLGWLNATLRCEQADPGLPRVLVTQLRDAARERSFEIGHVKAVLTGAGLSALAQCTTTNGEVSERIESAVGAGGSGTLILNARVQCAPEGLEQMVRELLPEALEASRSSGSISDLDCFSPGYPRPTHRYSEAVD